MVSIITINFNGYKDTCELIDSLKACETYPYELIVVDNNSDNNEAERIKAHDKDVIVVALEKNIGFAAGNNAGIEHASGEHIMFLNNDIIIHAPTLEILVNKLNSSEKIGAVSPKIKYLRAPDVIQYAGYTDMTKITVSNKLIGVGEHDKGQYDTEKQTPFIHGAGVMTSKKVLENAGTMSELYFLFYEELDWSIQLKNKGYQLWYVPQATVFHKESMTIKRGTPQRTYFLTRSRIVFTRRRTQGINYILAMCYQILASAPANIILSTIRGNWKNATAILRGTWSGLVTPVKQKPCH